MAEVVAYTCHGLFGISSQLQLLHGSAALSQQAKLKHNLICKVVLECTKSLFVKTGTVLLVVAA